MSADERHDDSCHDNRFGPGIGSGCRGGFDFTLLFEQAILSLLPTALFVLLALVRILQLRSRPSLRTQQWLLLSKQTLIWVLCVLQLALLIEWACHSHIRTSVTIAEQTVSLLAIPLTAALSYLEHRRSLRPSTLLNIFFIYSCLAGIVIIRTLWLLPVRPAIATLYSCCLALKIATLIFEAWECHPTSPSAQGSTAESRSGILARGVFAWLNSLLRSGYNTLLSLENLPDLESSMQTSHLRRQIESAWKADQKSSPNKLLFTLLRTFKHEIARAVLPRLCLIAFQLAQPFLISRVVGHLTLPGSQEARNTGYGLIAAAAIVYTGIAVSTGLYWHSVYRMIVSLRGGVVSLLYAKTLRYKASSSDESAALTLMVTDIEKVMLGFEDIHEIWANLVSVGVATWLLSLRLSWACVAPTVFSLACIAVMLWLSSSVNRSQQAWIKAIQTRVESTAKALGQMREVKLLAWSPRIETLLKTLRQREVDSSDRFRLLVVCNIFLSQIPNFAAPVVAFAFYLAVNAARGQSDFLNASTAFSSLSLIMLLTSPLALIIQAIPNLASAIGCISRMQAFLVEDDQRPSDPARSSSVSISNEDEKHDTGHTKKAIVDITKQDHDLKEDLVLTCRGAHFTWAPDGPGVRGIDLEVEPGSLVIVIGPVGSGKSTLLQGLLGETPFIRGFVSTRRSDVAYCSQESWLRNGTVRTNIIGEGAYDFVWYSTVVRACCLNTDFATWTLGDETLVGNNGLALSGGQRQRIAVARAVYSRRDLVLMDDILSGLDSQTKSLICKNVLGKTGLLEKHGKTRILVTHSYALLDADQVIQLSMGGPTLVVTKPSKALQRFESRDNSDIVDEVNKDDAEPDLELGPKAHLIPSSDESEIKGSPRRNGDWTIYRYYFSASGWLHLLGFTFVGAVFAFCQSFQPVWLDLWSSAPSAQASLHLGMYLGVYVLLVVIGLIALWWSCHIFLVSMVNRSAVCLHAVLVDTVLAAPLTFFTTTETGVTTNRFSQDMTLIDYNLPLAGVNVGLTGFTGVGQLVVVAAVSKFMACTVPFCFIALYGIQNVYLKTSRQLRLLDLETKSPLYTNNIETVEGLMTIRAYGWQEAFQARNDCFLDASQRPLYLLYSVQRWLQFVLDMLVAVLVTITVVLSVALAGYKGAPSAGGTGVALTSLVSFNITIGILIRFWTAMETSLSAISRIRDFAKITPSEDSKVAYNAMILPPGGTIVFDDVSMAYNGDRYVLSNITLEIADGERIGICGRSGSGKSTLVALLFRLIDPTQGKITIHGIDTTHLARETVRSHFNIVTQSSTFLVGSIRENLDPESFSSEEKIISTLAETGLWNEVVSQGGLDAPMMEGKWSAGQRQILCLVRALLRAGRARVLVLDEASSTIDGETGKVMQRLVESHVTGQSIIAIAHRLDSIRQYDKVAVLDNGRLVEFDDPDILLGREGSAFRLLWEEQENGRSK
ncbi:putative ABC transporter [Polychaeton citri CBS 116435]|uniref:ABC transporter n=1 Tax=Polychaeton citri CBS 116435 TaxID=1314669 RepID=A0A9P4Q085_9PEZI|nr:putative ABC transporter [Polychaeton citri CBS 116435]